MRILITALYFDTDNRKTLLYIPGARREKNEWNSIQSAHRITWFSKLVNGNETFHIGDTDPYGIGMNNTDIAMKFNNISFIGCSNTYKHLKTNAEAQHNNLAKNADTCIKFKMCCGHIKNGC